MGGEGSGRRKNLKTDAKSLARRARYARDPEYRARKKREASIWAQRRKAEFSKWRAGLTCSRCGFGGEWALDFHHVDQRGEDRSLASLYTNSRDAFIEECRLCVCLCANCHRWAHHLLNTDPQGYEDEIAPLRRVEVTVNPVVDGVGSIS